MKFTCEKVSSLLRETKENIKTFKDYGPDLGAVLLLPTYKINSKLMVDFTQAWDILAAKAISGTPSFTLDLDGIK